MARQEPRTSTKIEERKSQQAAAKPGTGYRNENQIKKHTRENKYQIEKRGK